MVWKAVLLAILYFQCITGTKLNQAKFPDDFRFGVASAAYQIEGAWNEDGKGENIWDRFIHENPEKIEGKATADIACDSYHRYKEDVQLVKNLGVDFYRFSISWSRILPDGLAHKVNQKGIDYYNNLLDELVAHNITPMATLYHWDLPQKLQDYGGWVNPNLVDMFEDYARIAFDHFGDRVKFWITFNEPWNTCVQGYGIDLKAPAPGLKGNGEYLCTHTIIKSHARAYHLYDREFRAKFQGKVSITLDAPWFEPATDSEEDAEAADRIRFFTMGWFAHPIYINGDYPEVMKQMVAERSKKEGFLRSRLPAFTEEEKQYIKGSSDFFAFNTYTSVLIKNDAEGAPIGVPSWFKDSRVGISIKRDWPGSASAWLKVVPWGFTKLLKWIQQNFGGLEIYVTENGYSDNKGEIEDIDRIIYYELYLSALLDAIEAGVNVKGYTFWTLMDNFEWTEGYEHVFGLYSIDFNHPNLPRTPKKSVTVIKKIIEDHQLPEEIHSSGAKYIFKDEL